MARAEPHTESEGEGVNGLTERMRKIVSPRTAGKVMLGVAGWMLISLAGAIYAQYRSLPVLETVVTGLEWVAAILILPTVLLWIVAIARADDIRRESVRRVVQRVHDAAGIGLVIFALDLLIRATFRMGFQPF